MSRTRPAPPSNKDQGARSRAQRHATALGQRPRTGNQRRIGSSALLAAALAVGAWHASGALFRDSARQRAADALASLQICLLGSGRPPGERPSQRIDAIEQRRGGHGGPNSWPAVCLGYARALDAALRAPALKHALGPTPSAVEVVVAEPPSSRGAQLDALFDTLRRADLPAGHPAVGIGGPTSTGQARPRRLALSSLGHAGLAPLQARIPRDGSVRLLLLGHTPRLCVLRGGRSARHPPAAACDPLPQTLAHKEALRLARSEPLAPTLIYGAERSGRDGFFDAASGLRVWRPRDAAAQAAVRDDGTTLVLYAERGGERGKPGQGARRLVLLRPGRAPDNQRLGLPRGASVLLWPRALLWWGPTSIQRPEDENIAMRTLGDGDRWLGPQRRLGRIPRGARMRDSCAHGQTTAALLSSPTTPDSALLLIGHPGAPNDTVRIDRALAAGKLSCHQGYIWLTRLADEQLLAQQCTAQGCKNLQALPLPSSPGKLVAASPLGQRLVLATAGPTGTVALQAAEPAAQLAAPERRWQLVDGDGVELRPRALRLLTSGATAWLLIETRGDALYAAYLDREGALRSVGLATEPIEAPNEPAR